MSVPVFFSEPANIQARAPIVRDHPGLTNTRHSVYTPPHLPRNRDAVQRDPKVALATTRMSVQVDSK